MFNIDTGLWNFHRESISKKKNDIDEFSQKLKSDIRKRHAAWYLKKTRILFQNVAVTVSVGVG